MRRTIQPGLPGAQHSTLTNYGTTTVTAIAGDAATPALNNPIPASDDPRTDTGGDGGDSAPTWDPDKVAEPSDPRREELVPA